MEGSIELDLGWEREIHVMDLVGYYEDNNSVLSCIEDLASEDLLWASTTIEREGTTMFDTKLLDHWSSNVDHGFTTSKGKYKINNEIGIEDILLGSESGYWEESNMSTGDEPISSGDSTQSICSGTEEEDPASTQHSTFDEQKRIKALDQLRALHRKAGRSFEWRRGDKLERRADEIEEEEEEEEEEGQYIVKDIVSRRLKKRKGGESEVPTCPEDSFEYLVKWEGYGSEDDTWEPYANVSHLTEHLERLYQKMEEKNRSKHQPSKRRATVSQQKTKTDSTTSGKSQFIDNNNNIELFDRNNEEQQKKRKRFKRGQLSDDEDGDKLWVPEAKRRRREEPRKKKTASQEQARKRR